MKFYFKACKRILLIILFHFLFFPVVFAQSDPVSLSSMPAPAQWVPVPVGVMPVNTNVTIIKGDTVSLDVQASCTKLTIDSGATLNAAGNASAGNNHYLQVGGANPQGIDTLLNNGVFGSASGVNDGIVLAISPASSNLKLTGAGVTAIGGIRPTAANKSLIFHLSQNAALNNSGLAFSALPLIDSNAAADNITFNVDTGISLKLTNSRGQVQGMAANGKGGNYTYNIYGLMDLSATKDTQNFVPANASTGAVITANVSGKLKLGSGFNGAANPAGGKAVFNILPGGLVDAANTTYLNMGANFFATSPKGFLKRRVDDTGETFPVGAPGSGTYNPVTLNNKGAVTNFSVSVQNNPDNNLLPDPTKTVDKYWTILPDTTGSDVTVEPAWLQGDQEPNFNPAQSVSVVSYSNNSLVEKAAKVTGSGTAANPYVAAAPGFITFGYFVVLNSKVNTAGAMKLYPNPVSDVINVSFPAIGSNGAISISTTNGQKMLTGNISNGSSDWSGNIAAWPPGVYIFTLNNGGKLSSLKFIKL